MVPSAFARLAVLHGTVATVSDPHEIANVMGVEGVRFMQGNGRSVPFHFFFGAPSCVPATEFETAGAELDAAAVAELLDDPDILYLSEMMNYPGVLSGDPSVAAKLNAAASRGKPVDGHAPGLRGEAARRYFAAGISTDHECFSQAEGREKAVLGVQVLIREGSAARNFDALIPLLREFPGQVMFCSDDKHPDDLMAGHINTLAARAVGLGYDLFDVLWAACLAPIRHYRLPVGQLRPGDPADFIVVEDLEHFSVRETWIEGRLVAKDGKSLIPAVPVSPVNRFDIGPIAENSLRVEAPPGSADMIPVRVIGALDGQLVTRPLVRFLPVAAGQVWPDPGKDILRIVVVNRYRRSAPALGFIEGFGIRGGAIASCVAHDSHNIVAVGDDEELIRRAVNLVIGNKGGISAVSRTEGEKVLPLPIAGIMSGEPAEQVGRLYQELDVFARKNLGSPLRAPFMTLSFMALLVIPSLKMSDAGLFDGDAFRLVPLVADES
jgi:adenine deaminase